MSRALPLLAVLLSHWRRQPLQFITLFLGLALATALWTAVQAINAEAGDSYDKASKTLGQSVYAQLVPRFGEDVPEALFAKLRRAGWLVSPVLEGSVMVGEQRLWVIGVEPLTSPAGVGAAGLALENRSQSAFAEFLEQKAVFAQPDTLALIEDVDSELLVFEEPDAPQSTVIADIGLAQQLLSRPGRVSRFIVAPNVLSKPQPLDDITPSLRLNPPEEGVEASRLTGSFHLNLTAFGLLSFAVGLFIVQGAIRLAFEDRMATLRTLRTLGVSLRHVMIALVAELSLLAIVAGLFGVVIGYGLAAALMPDVAATLQGLYGAQVDGGLRIRPQWALTGLGISLAGTALAAGASLLQSARMPLLATGHRSARHHTAQQQRRHLLALGAFAFCVSGVLMWAASGLVAAFIMLACLLLGGAFLLPAFLERILGFGESLARRWSASALAQWFLSDTRFQLSGLSLALMALMLAIATNIGVSTMVQSFRTAFVSFLDQRLAASFYVDVENPEKAAAMVKGVAPVVDDIMPILSQETELAGAKAIILGLRINQTYKTNFTFLDAESDIWEALQSTQAVSINEQMAVRDDLN
ncbi:MAG: FtsX-like permease family protein, partial [Pseudomonadota bacterium]